MTLTATTCEGTVYQRGADRRCGQSVAVSTWSDHTGRPHAACPRHRGGLLRRNPVALPEPARCHLSDGWCLVHDTADTPDHHFAQPRHQGDSLVGIARND